MAVVGVEYDPNPIETWTDLDSLNFCSSLILDEGWMVMVTMVSVWWCSIQKQTQTKKTKCDPHF